MHYVGDNAKLSVCNRIIHNTNGRMYMFWDSNKNIVIEIIGGKGNKV